jgi:hypothetical protein
MSRYMTPVSKRSARSRGKKPRMKTWRVSLEWLKPGEPAPVKCEEMHAYLKGAKGKYKKWLTEVWVSGGRGEKDFRVAVNRMKYATWEKAVVYLAEGKYR